MFKFYYTCFSSIKHILFLCNSGFLSYFLWLWNMRASIKYCSRSCLAHSVENIDIWSSIDIFHSVKYSILIGQNNSHQYQRMIRVIWRKCGDTEFRYCAPVVPNIFGTWDGLFHWGCQEEELRRASLMAPFLTGHGLDRYQPAVGGGGGDRTSELFI